MLDVIGEIMENRLEFDVYEDEDLILSNRNHNDYKGDGNQD
jgi:hypothetical protein